MDKVVVLGAGLVGLPMAIDIAADSEFEVTLVDVDPDKLLDVEKYGITATVGDLSDSSQLKSIISTFKYVINAVPGFMGFNTLKTCIEMGKDIVDIAFYPEDVFELSELAKKHGVRVVCDFGVAPGMSNLLTGFAASKMDSVDDIKIFVGGLPKIRTKPWEYKAVFSPSDVIEEYTRPARIVRNGEVITVEPLTEIELLEFDKIGTLEAFNSDGLRSLLSTVKAKNMVEKTLRYPGYAKKISLLNEIGFFNPQKEQVDGVMVSPLSLTSTLLFDSWKLNDNEEDFTVMRIIVEGIKDNRPVKYSFDLYDEYCNNTGIHSMARTTGYSATMALRMLAQDKYIETGITLGENLGQDEVIVNFILDGLKKRGISYKITSN